MTFINLMKYLNIINFRSKNNLNGVIDSVSKLKLRIKKFLFIFYFKIKVFKLNYRKILNIKIIISILLMKYLNFFNSEIKRSCQKRFGILCI